MRNSDDPRIILGLHRMPHFTAEHAFQNMPLGLLGFIIAATAGLMIYITVDELIPSGCAGSDHRTLFSLVSGIVFVLLLGML